MILTVLRIERTAILIKMWKSGSYCHRKRMLNLCSDRKDNRVLLERFIGNRWHSFAKNFVIFKFGSEQRKWQNIILVRSLIIKIFKM